MSETGPRLESDGAPTELAPQHLRMFALIVDYLLSVVLLNIAGKLMLGADWDLRPPSPPGLQVAWLAAGLLLLALRDAVAGQSPGKWFTGIAAVSADAPTTAAPFFANVLRNATLVLLPVEAVLVFGDRYCRRLGDRIAGTVVVVRPHPAPVTRRLLGVAIVFLGTMLAIFLAEYWNVRRSAAYPLAVRLAETDEAVQTTFGGDVSFSAPGLQRSKDGTEMLVQLAAEGDAGQGLVQVHLRRAGPPPHWEPGPVEITHAPSTEADAAPTEPQQQDAPPR